MFTPGWSEMVILGFIALLLFGKRLPEVARSLGQGFVEFKRGMTNFETDMKSTVYSDPPVHKTVDSTPKLEEDLRPATEKFEVPEPEQTEQAEKI